MAVHIHPLDIPPKFYKPIGQIAVGWSLSEAFISSIVWHIHKIKNPKVGRLFIYRCSAKQKLDILKLSADKYVPDHEVRSQLIKLHSAASRLKGRRNTIIHGLWGRMPKEKKTWKVFYSKDTDDTYTLKKQSFTLAELQALAEEVRQLNKDLRYLMRKMKIPPI
jgi:hypothetical protein